MAHDVFISYAREDKSVADTICARLEAERIRCWMAPRDILAGDWREAIMNAIEGSRLMVFILSSHSNQSKDAGNEIQNAVNKGITIVPFLIEAVVLSKSLEYNLAKVHWLDALTPPLERHIAHLVDTVRRFLAGGGLPEGPLGTPGLPRAAEGPVRPRADKRTRIGRYAFVAACLLVALLAVYYEGIGPLVASRLAEAEVLVRSHRWVTYNLPEGEGEYNPNPDLQRAARELLAIRRAGFDGVITFTSAGGYVQIPRLAREADLRVIAGIWNPRDSMEVAGAIRQREYVDGYCVGNNGLMRKDSYSFDELAAAIRRVRFRTGRPVTTSEKIGLYLSDARLLAVGDWVFPDVHVSVKDAEGGQPVADAVRDATQTISMAQQIGHRKERGNRPILLKMVMYPMGGVSQASLDEQTRFFVAILDGRRDALPDMPCEASVSVHSAFDIPWKRGYPYFEWDRYTGLLEADGTPRPAAVEIVKRLP